MNSHRDQAFGRLDRAMRRRADGGAGGAVLSEASVPSDFVSPWELRLEPAQPAEAPDRGDARLTPPLSSPAFSPAWMPRLVIAPQPETLLVEQFRQLAAVLHQAQVSGGTRTLLITSAEPAEGKSMVAVNLGITLASSYGKEVLVLDADLRRPSLHEIGQLPNATGLGDALKGPVDRKLPVFRVSERLTFAPAGPPDSDPMTALASPRMGELLQESAQRFDWVIVDGPPVGPIADATLLAPVVDAVLLVVRAGRTHYAAAQKAVDAIGRSKIIGVVLNAADHVETAGYRHYYEAYGGAAAGGGTR